jgi:ribonucleoside-diphosphate reductase alpha chain
LQCNLGAINLEEFIRDDPNAIPGYEWFSARAAAGHIWDRSVLCESMDFCNQIVDVDALRETTRIAVRFLDNVIDITNFPVDKVNKRSRETRRVGLGIMGLADALMKAMVPYNSDIGVHLAEFLMNILETESVAETKRLAREKGAFPLFSKSAYAHGDPRRNAALLTVAPTGTTSLVFNVCGGVEPYFSLYYTYDKKAVLDGKTDLSTGMNRHFFTQLQQRFPHLVTDSVVEEVRRTGSVLKNEEFWSSTRIPLDFRRIYATSMDIAPKDHVRMQAALQKYVDNSMSKTINLPNSASVQDVMDVYMSAWKQGCKGCTVYRDGSRVLQVLRSGEENEISDSVSISESASTSETESRDDLVESCRLDASANGGGVCIMCSE